MLSETYFWSAPETLSRKHEFMNFNVSNVSSFARTQNLTFLNLFSQIHFVSAEKIQRVREGGNIFWAAAF